MKILLKIFYQATRFILLLIRPSTVGVRLLMVREDEVLLVKPVYENKWHLPGGLVETGETLNEAVRREALEEVGATINDLQLFGAYTEFKDKRNNHIIVFISKNFSLNGKTDYEIEDLSFFLMNTLPERISVGSRNRILEYKTNEVIRFGSW